MRKPPPESAKILFKTNLFTRVRGGRATVNGKVRWKMLGGKAGVLVRITPFRGSEFGGIRAGGNCVTFDPGRLLRGGRDRSQN